MGYVKKAQMNYQDKMYNDFEYNNQMAHVCIVKFTNRISSLK